MSETLTADRPPSSATPNAPQNTPARQGAFANAEQAWFWTLSALNARHTGAEPRALATPTT
jgi:hypothetical protein